ncbi:MAG: acetylglutamate kinase [Oscillospiraceae bacterium]|nr:acetylglutamate kinase [Oscillospiraceae bacterium]
MDISINNVERAQILTEALPYIKKYYGKVVVVKYGGSAMLNDELKKAVMGDLVLLQLIGIKVVLVHGGGPEITQMLGRIGKKSVFVDGLRVTDEETAEIVQMVLAGKVGKGLVNLIELNGGKAVGLSGADGHLIEAEMKDERLGFVGEVTKINIEPVSVLLEKGYIPVISTVGCDSSGYFYNINADTAAAKIAGALNAESLLSMTDTPGILRDFNDPGSLIRVVDISEAKKLTEDGVISGGMIPKVGCCIDALNGGVKKVFIIDGRVPHSILIELLTDEGIGTMFIGQRNGGDGNE